MEGGGGGEVESGFVSKWVLVVFVETRVVRKWVVFVGVGVVGE